MSADKKKIEALARRLRDAQDTGDACAPLRDDMDEGDLETAYAVQLANTQYWIGEGRRISGRKVGLTAKTVQEQLGVDQPDFGILYADLCVGDGQEIAMSRVMQPKVEAEVALVLEHDLKMEKPTVAEIINATAYALPAIEIVCSRIANWDIRIQDTIADNASLGLYVLGGPKRKLDDLDLRMCGMVMECGGDQVSVGAGLACLGNPLNAAAWLADKMVEIGMPLRAGDTIMTGSLGAMAPVEPGSVVEARIGGLGSVRAAFGAAVA